LPRRSIIDLASGRMSLAVAREKMMPGDSVEIRTSVAIAGVRGTVVIAEILPGDGAAAARFTVLKGLVEVSGLDPATRQMLGAPTLLAARQTVLADRRGVAPPITISRQAAERLGAEFQTPPPPPPAEARAVATETHVQKAAEHARDLAATSGGRKSDGPGGRRGRGDGERKDGPSGEPTPVSDLKPDGARPEGPRPDKPDVPMRPDLVKPEFKAEPPKPEGPKRERDPRPEVGKDARKLDRK
jgi:hypothetical protein